MFSIVADFVANDQEFFFPERTPQCGTPITYHLSFRKETCYNREQAREQSDHERKPMISFPNMLLRLCLALLLGACIGAERQSHDEPAGLRTNTLVALGTCLFMLISAYGFSAFLTISHFQVDPSRIASYVVAGIGFLGAGTIFRTPAGEQVRGMTTAAAIWVVAAIGLACGLGLILEAVVTTALALTILIFMRVLERWIWPHKFQSVQSIRITTPTVTSQLIEDLYQICMGNGSSLQQIGILRRQEDQRDMTIELVCLALDLTTFVRIVGELQALPWIVTLHADSPESQAKGSTLKRDLNRRASQK
jgi:putative Mg2+ transporter-C (MgtC) family protein